MEPPPEFSAVLNFFDIAKRLEKIYGAKEQKDKARYFEKFLESLRKNQEKFFQQYGENANGSLYPFLRLFLPKYDNERDSYGIQIKTLGKMIVKALAISDQSKDAKKLMIQQIGMSSDFGEIVQEVMESRAGANPTLSVYDVNRYLDLIAEHFHQNERKKIDIEMAHLFSKMTALECKWLVRIILKKLGLNVQKGKLLRLYHPDTAKLYDQCYCLSRVCNVIDSGQTVDNLFELFLPIRQMLCEKAQLHEINEMLAKDEFYLETKMDGERYHIHINMNENKFKYFSRSSNEDFTAKFGHDNSGGSYTPRLHPLLSNKVQNVILDGEIMVWNRLEAKFQRRTENISARHLHPNDSTKNPCFVIFDIIYLDGVFLLNKPYAERIRLLRSKLTEKVGELVFCKREKIENSEQFLTCLNNALDANEEGIVIKRAGSSYLPGRREGGGWFKIKPDYEKNLITDFDLLIIGAYYNETRTFINQFLVGVFEKDDNQNNAGVFHAACKIGSGLNRQQFADLLEKLEPYWKSIAKGGQSTISANDCTIELNKTTPDLWIEPKHSVVLQIKGADFIQSSKYATSHTFQFPRIISVRYDKPWYDACSLKELQKFINSTENTANKLTKRHANASDLNKSEQTLPKRKKNDTAQKPLGLTKQLMDFKVFDNICEGLDFQILNDDKKMELKAMILKHGGRVVENPGDKTYACIATRNTGPRVRMAINSGKHNIVWSKWVEKALGEDKPLTKLLRFTPSDMIFATPALVEEFANHFDAYGDSFTKQTKVEEMEEFLAKMPTDKLPNLTNSEIHEMELQLSDRARVHSMFRLDTAYFYFEDGDNNNKNRDFDLARTIFKQKAGNCLNSAQEIKKSNSRLTHVFVDEDTLDRNKLLSTIKTWTTEDIDDIAIVRYQWIWDCHRKKEKICDESYKVRKVLL